MAITFHGTPAADGHIGSGESTPPPERAPRQVLGKAAYLLIMAQSYEERSFGAVVSNQQELQSLQNCLGFRRRGKLII